MTKRRGGGKAAEPAIAAQELDMDVGPRHPTHALTHLPVGLRGDGPEREPRSGFVGRLRFQAKRPGQTVTLNPVDMIFNYKDTYGDDDPEAYETLLLDVMEGNATLFMRADQVEAAWKIIQPIQEVWQTRQPVDFPNYAPGSWGPEDAEALIAKDGHHWVTLTEKA